jgi:hypothetical protein
MSAAVARIEIVETSAAAGDGVTALADLFDFEVSRPDLSAVDQHLDAVVARRESIGVLQVELGGFRAVGIDGLGGLGDDPVLELPLHTDHALARTGLHGYVNGFARLEQARNAGDAPVLIERSPDLNIGQLRRARARHGDGNRKRQRAANDDTLYFFSSVMRP